MADAEPRPGAFTEILIPSSTPASTVTRLYQTGGILMWNGATLQGAASTITTTGTQVALAAPAGTAVLFSNNATLLTIQGITAGTDGQLLAIFAIGTGQIDIANQNGSATAANRIINGVTGTISLAAGTGRILLTYDATTARWRVLMHEQGSWITPAYNAANFTAGSGTWTVDAGDVTTYAYFLKGNTLYFNYRIVTSSVSATPSSLIIAVPGGFLPAKNTEAPGTGKDVATQVNTRINGSGGVGTLTNNINPAANWSVATNTTEVSGQLTLEVQ